MNSLQDDPELPGPGFPIRRSSDQRLLSGFPRLIAAGYVLLRRLAPRHPPCALSSLTIIGKARGGDRFKSVPPARLDRVSYHALALLFHLGHTSAFANARRRLPICNCQRPKLRKRRSFELASLRARSFTAQALRRTSLRSVQRNLFLPI